MMRAKADRLCHHGEDIQTCDGLHFSEEILEVLGGKTVTITEAQLRDAMEHHSYHPTVGSYRDEHCGANSCAGAVFERLMK